MAKLQSHVDGGYESICVGYCEKCTLERCPHTDMQAHVDEIAARIEAITEGYWEDNWEELEEYFSGVAGIGFRTDDDGEYVSAHVLLTFGPTIQLDTATGEIYCWFYGRHGEAKLSSHAVKSINAFFKYIHHC